MYRTHIVRGTHILLRTSTPTQSDTTHTLRYNRGDDIQFTRTVIVFHIWRKTRFASWFGVVVVDVIVVVARRTTAGFLVPVRSSPIINNRASVAFFLVSFYEHAAHRAQGFRGVSIVTCLSITHIRTTVHVNKSHAHCPVQTQCGCDGDHWMYNCMSHTFVLLHPIRCVWARVIVFMWMRDMKFAYTFACIVHQTFQIRERFLTKYFN